MNRQQLKVKLLKNRILTPKGHWYWTGKARVGKEGAKYPYMRVGKRMMKVTRAASLVWKIKGEGPILRHDCDDTECWRPNHLTKGTTADNQQDMVERNRSLYGERHNLVKLSSEEVLQIKLRGANGESSSNIAKDYPVQRRQISRIIEGTRWVKL